MGLATGRLFDGRSAGAVSVSVYIRANELVIEDEAGTPVGVWSLDELRDVSPVPSKIEISLSFGEEDPARLTIGDAGFIADIRRQCQTLNKRRPLQAGWWKPYAIWIGGGAASVAVLFVFVLPFLATVVANMLSDDTRDRIGRETKDYIIKTFARDKSPDKAICEGTAGQAALEGLVARLASAEAGTSTPITLTVVKSKVPNALALPGGHMVIFSEMIDHADRPDALAGVLAHEIAHIREKHPINLFVTNVGIATVFSLVLGDISGGTIIAGVGQMAVGAAYTRDFEREADSLATRIMTEWQYDMSAMIPLLRSLEPKARFMHVPIFATHPGMEERIEKIEAAGNTGAGPALGADEWAAVKAMCGA
ncbi:M48 family metallopeptidase [Sneathiella chinensis]|uniref:Metalloendopeptidase n=1 Tax=Sneathiella chinensis TaxID=349750 RepID=A0ABQ5U7M6_9PROT|nr:M48 family metallopeptidase [Sneathiella chinensis]GLQ07678.1 metalloendopeptidase [Sneathiella chinensis]